MYQVELNMWNMSTKNPPDLIHYEIWINCKWNCYIIKRILFIIKPSHVGYNKFDILVFKTILMFLFTIVLCFRWHCTLVPHCLISWFNNVFIQMYMYCRINIVLDQWHWLPKINNLFINNRRLHTWMYEYYV